MMSESFEASPGTLALIVVNYGSSNLLAENLRTLKSVAGIIIVVDNFTSHCERETIRELAKSKGWISVLLDDNRGFGGGVNVGAERALREGVDVIVALNPDAHIDDDDLRRLASAATMDRDLLVAPTIRTSSGDIWFDGVDLCAESGRMATSRTKGRRCQERKPWISGACFAMSAVLWERAGGFDEEYFLYWEDVDLSHRVLAVGGRLAVLSDVAATHDEGGTQASVSPARGKSETYYYYNIRNRLVYAAKHLDSPDIWRWFWNTPQVSYEILLGGGRRQFTESIAPARAYLRGIRDGIRMLVTIRRRGA